jgi:hypothetical protein
LRRRIRSEVLALPLPFLGPLSGPSQHPVEQLAALGLPLLEARQRLAGRALDRAVVGAVARGGVAVVLPAPRHRRLLRFERLLAGEPEHPQPAGRQIRADRRGRRGRRGRRLARSGPGLGPGVLAILRRQPRAELRRAGMVLGDALPGAPGEQRVETLRPRLCLLLCYARSAARPAVLGNPPVEPREMGEQIARIVAPPGGDMLAAAEHRHGHPVEGAGDQLGLARGARMDQRRLPQIGEGGIAAAKAIDGVAAHPDPRRRGADIAVQRKAIEKPHLLSSAEFCRCGRGIAGPGTGVRPRVGIQHDFARRIAGQPAPGPVRRGGFATAPIPGAAHPARPPRLQQRGAGRIMVVGGFGGWAGGTLRGAAGIVPVVVGQPVIGIVVGVGVGAGVAVRRLRLPPPPGLALEPARQPVLRGDAVFLRESPRRRGPQATSGPAVTRRPIAIGDVARHGEFVKAVGDIGSIGHAKPPVPESAAGLTESASPSPQGSQARPRAGRSGRKPLRSTAAG